MNMNYGLIGKGLSHSYSKRLFEERFAAHGHGYELISLNEIAELGMAVDQYALSGFNVTIPYKQQIIPLLDGLSDEAKTIGAVNVVVMAGKQMVGYNTDAVAFKETIEEALESHHKKVLVLGNGGASKAVVWALNQLDLEVKVATHEDIALRQEQLAKEPFDVLVNATPVGMFPKVEDCVWSYVESFDEHTLVYDLVYNPTPTMLMKKAQERGAKVMDGMQMLKRQAELSWQIWGLLSKA